MSDTQFRQQAASLSIAEIVGLTGAVPAPGVDLDRRVSDIAALDLAGPHDLAFLDNPKYAGGLAACRAGACMTSEKFAASLPSCTAGLSSPNAYAAFVAVARKLFPDTLRPRSFVQAAGVSPAAVVDPHARLEPNVTIDAGATVAAGSEIGSGSIVGAGAAIGPGVRIGRDCSIAAGVTISHALIGDRVIIHPGCRIGQDGFGYLPGAKGHQKVPQLGRVIIQDNVEIGANTTVDRGAVRDTIIGEGTKIDNQVQVGHNVTIGRHCIIVAQTGISGSATLMDFVVLGARVGVNNHVTIGEGAQIAAISIVNGDVPAGARWGGTPAKPTRIWFREMKTLEALARRPSAKGDRPGEQDKTEQQ